MTTHVPLPGQRLDKFFSQINVTGFVLVLFLLLEWFDNRTLNAPLVVGINSRDLVRKVRFKSGSEAFKSGIGLGAGRGNVRDALQRIVRIGGFFFIIDIAVGVVKLIENTLLTRRWGGVCGWVGVCEGPACREPRGGLSCERSYDPASIDLRLNRAQGTVRLEIV